MTHIYPVNDIIEHDLDTTTCECQPKIEEVNGEMLVIHNSYDGRELMEQAKEILKNALQDR